jgi:hypothetical protein
MMKKAFRPTTLLHVALPLFLAAGCGDRDDAPPSTQVADQAEELQAETPAGTEQPPVNAEQVALQKSDPRGTYGAGILLKAGVALGEILADPESYESRIVQVRGTVDAVCPRRGCWIDLADSDGASVRVKVTDGEIVFPLSAKGHEVLVEGAVERIELTEEQHRAWKAHEAEELGVAFDPASVNGPTTMWRIQGFGARIDD